MFRIGLIGAGWVTQHHLLAWQRQGARAKVTAIADPARERAEQRARAFAIEHVYDDARAMLDAGALDAVDIAAPREFHAPLVREAAARGLPILCQKPLAPTYDEACELTRDVAGKTRLMVHENWRFRAYYRQIAAWLKAGRVGRVQQAQMTLFTSGLLADAHGKYPALERQPFIATLERALVMEVLIHHIDALRFLLGELTLEHSRIGHTSRAMAGEDRASLTLSSADGAVVHLMASFTVHGAEPAQSDKLVIVGERGTIVLDGARLTLHGAETEELRYDLQACYIDSYAGAIAHFVDALADGTPFETAPDDNLRTLAIVEDIYARG
jgi:predicted dehydrogenase